MSSELQYTELSQSGNRLCVKLKRTSSMAYGTTRTDMSNNMVLCGLVEFQIRSIVKYAEQDNLKNHSQSIAVRFTKIFQTDPQIYSVQLTMNLQAEKKFSIHDFNIDNACWQTFYENLNMRSTFIEFELVLTLDVCSSIFTGFNSLYEDTEITDFELRGIDGSVKVHKAILAGYSPVMKNMLAGEWKETASGFIDVKASEQTLMQLKDFMYLHKLPEGDVKELAVFASLYMISDLEECCTVKLLTSITAGNAADLLDFAVKYNMERVKLGILVNFKHELIKMEDMIKKTNADDCTAENQSAYYALPSAP